MAKTWEQEKAYCARRAEALGAEMDAAIETGDRDRFTVAYQKVMRYMTVRQRSTYYRRWLQSPKREKVVPV